MTTTDQHAEHLAILREIRDGIDTLVQEAWAKEPETATGTIEAIVQASWPDYFGWTSDLMDKRHPISLDLDAMTPSVAEVVDAYSTVFEEEQFIQTEPWEGSNSIISPSVWQEDWRTKSLRDDIEALAKRVEKLERFKTYQDKRWDMLDPQEIVRRLERVETLISKHSTLKERLDHLVQMAQVCP